MSYRRNTNKLFYGKYVNKVVVQLELAGLFRENSIERIRKEVDSWKHHLEKADSGKIKVGSYYREMLTLRQTDIMYALLDRLDKEADYKLRVEGRSLSIYSNNDVLIDDVISAAEKNIRYSSRPKTDKIRNYLLANPAAVVVADSSYRYRVITKPMRGQADSFISWANKLSKVKVSSCSSIKYSDGFFYVADDKTLSMCRLYLGDRMRKVESLIQEDEI